MLHGDPAFFSHASGNNLLANAAYQNALKKFIILAVKLATAVEKMKTDPLLLPYFNEMVKLEKGVKEAQQNFFEVKLDEIVRRCGFHTVAEEATLERFKAGVLALYNSTLDETKDLTQAPEEFNKKLTDNIHNIISASIERPTEGP